MKKLLLSLVAFTISANVMMAEDPIASIEFTQNSTAYGKVSGYNVDWESTDGMWKFSAFNNNNNGWNFIAAGWKTDATTPTIASGKVCPVEVSSIVVSIADRLTPSSITSAVLYVADDAEFVNAVTTTLTIPTEKNSDWVIDVPTPAANKFYKLVLSVTKQSSSNGQAISVSKIALYKNKYEAPAPTEATSVKNIKEVVALASGTKVKVDFPMTVAFKNYSNVFAFDANGDFIQIYGSNTYEAVDIIPAGWEATYDFYQSTTPELKPSTLPAATEKGEFTPKAVAPAAITTDLVNQVILINNVVLAEASPAEKANFTATADGVELSFRNNYTLASVEAGTYNITVVVTVYQGAPSLYVVNYAPADGSSVAEIEAASSEAVYFNLQGVKVDNPEKGLYIKVEGNKASKVIF